MREGGDERLERESIIGKQEGGERKHNTVAAELKNDGIGLFLIYSIQKIVYISKRIGFRLLWWGALGPSEQDTCPIQLLFGFKVFFSDLDCLIGFGSDFFL